MLLLIDAETRAKLLANGERQTPLKGTCREIDFEPVVKLFTPDAAATWPLTELDPAILIWPSVSAIWG